jgi:phosphoribosylglycinamide formyltransferase
MFHIACFISGTGSNLEKLINYIKHNGLDNKAKIKLVLSNNKNAYGLRYARHNKIKEITESIIKPINYKQLTISEKLQIRTKYDLKLFNYLINNRINIVYCLGWNMILGSKFIQLCEQNNIKLINLHPSLPEDNKLIGLNSVERAYQQFLRGERVITGIMVHNIIMDVDKGKPIYWDSLDISKCKNKKEYLLKINMIEKKVVVNALIKVINNM